ncbi:uncharacterized protein SAPINGB_P000971 [Magnusiomyces paraingens]|uniref:Ras modification protein ERF4 n=1 Tax=Magnusiomyces paraingens TaxID=2606893 RepID=A0A5E8B9I5_9ASCO|nr:uncharacterized protein SAPINGB_P000971 [Saprochaete ingens]VVT45948.1 unnamed protein product [Saprochaete ingens]
MSSSSSSIDETHLPEQQQQQQQQQPQQQQQQQSSSQSSESSATDNNTIKFYNYHEYFLQPDDYEAQLDYLENPALSTMVPATDYRPVTPVQPDDQSSPTLIKSAEPPQLEIPTKPVLIVHFPNSYYPATHPLYRRTRIVRIPREYSQYGDIVPQFSTYFPGTEPGALHSRTSKRRERAKKINNSEKAFYTSAENRADDVNDNNEEDEVTYLVPETNPLAGYLGLSQFSEIVTTVNLLLKRALWPYSVVNVVEQALGYATCWTHMYFLQAVLAMVATVLSAVAPSTAKTGAWGLLPELRNGSLSYLSTHTGRGLARLERYIVLVNRQLETQQHPVRIISPLRSAYLSLDFEVPSPVPGEQYEE